MRNSQDETMMGSVKVAVKRLVLSSEFSWDVFFSQAVYGYRCKTCTEVGTIRIDVRVPQRATAVVESSMMKHIGARSVKLCTVEFMGAKC